MVLLGVFAQYILAQFSSRGTRQLIDKDDRFRLLIACEPSLQGFEHAGFGPIGLGIDDEKRPAYFAPGLIVDTPTTAASEMPGRSISTDSISAG